MHARLVAFLAVSACGAPAVDRGAPRTTIAWQPPVEIAHGGGTKGPWRQNDSNFDYVDDPSVALAPDGSAAVVWVDQRDKDVHFQRIAAKGTRSQAVNVSRTPDIFSWMPRIATAGDDVFVAWQEIIFSGGSHGGDILFARSHDGGHTFSTPINLSHSLGGAGKGRIDAKTWDNGSLDLARAPDGTLYVAWTEYDGPLMFTSSLDGGATFAAPIQVAGSYEHPARAPSIAASDGAVYLAWTYGEDAAADIHVAKREGDRFGAPLVVAHTPTYSDAPKLALTGNTLHVAYAETTGGPFAPSRIAYTRLRGIRFEPPRTIGDGRFPSLGVDHHIVIVWDSPDRHGLELATSTTGDRFTAPRLVDGTRDPAGGVNGSQQGGLLRRFDARDDEVVVVTSAFARGRGSRVWLVRGRIE